MKIYEGTIDDVALLDKPEVPAPGLYLRLHDRLSPSLQSPCGEETLIIIDLDLLPYDQAWYEARKNQKIKITCSWTLGEIPLVDVALI